MYRNPKKVGAYRKNLLVHHTNMRLFQGEIETNICQVTQQLHVKGTTYIATTEHATSRLIIYYKHMHLVSMHVCNKHRY